MILANIFQPLIDIFGPVLVFFHGIIGGSWGWSIVLLTVVVRALLAPLAVKQMHSMQKLQRVAPRLKQIQAKYNDDKQRQQQEMMKFYKENDINPFASFLPLVAQIPVFIGLYYTLRTQLRVDICPGLQRVYRALLVSHHGVSVKDAAGQTVACHGLNGSSFLFIHDLTNTATGLTLVALIVLYVGTQLASTLMMQAPTMDKTQQRMMMLLPLVFVIFIIRFPAGLIVYWITTNAWTIGQQYVIRKRIGPVTPLPATDPSAGAADGRGDGTGPNGAGAGARAGLLRGGGGPEDKQPAAVGSGNRPRRDSPPRPRKKKRSGRRR